MSRKYKNIVIGGAGLLSVLGYQVYQNQAIKIDFKELRYKDLPEELEDFKICHISDLQGVVFGKDNKRLAQMINGLKADIICITGDMVHTFEDDGEAFINLVESLDKNVIKLFVPGNHETTQKSLAYFSKLNREVLYRKLANYNFHVLRGDTFKLDNLPIVFSGFEDDYDIYEGINYKEEKFEVEKYLPSIDDSKINVALVHRPNYFRKVADLGYDLMLSGHTHGGILRVGKVGLISPEKGFFPEFVKGLYKRDDKFLNVTSGLGNSKPVFKIGNRPEISMLVLRYGDPDLMNIQEVK